MRLVGIILVVFALSVWSAPFAEDEESSRLPKTSIPLSYDLTLKTRVKVNQRSFSGTVKIGIEITENTNVITLHNRGLSVQSVKLIAADKTEIPQTHDFEAVKDFMHVRVDSRELLIGEKFSLEIAFSGNLQLDNTGFYRSSYRVGSNIR